MDHRNHSPVTYFIFEPLTDVYSLKIILFLLVLTMYLMILLGNLLIIIVTLTNSALQSPMYFFLRSLSFLDLGYTSAIIPKLLSSLLLEDMHISFVGCATQMYFFGSLGIAECCLLAAMSYDRYVAICHPLHYSAIMNRTICLKMSAVCWIIGMSVFLVPSVLIFTLPFCGPNKINHFFCDTSPLLRLACTNSYKSEVIIFTNAVVFELFPFLLILISYNRILHAILKISGTTSRNKAFSTCSSHVTVVTLFYGTVLLTYLRPKSASSVKSDIALSFFYTVVCPMLNPLIYTLRNQEVKDSLKKLMRIKPPLATV